MKIRYMEDLFDRQNSRDSAVTSGHYHSRSFKRHFEGYVEYKETDANGKLRIRRVYRGVYYSQNLPRARRILLRVLYAALFLAIAALFVSSAIRRMDCNSCWYVAIGQCCSMISLVWAATALCSYLTAPIRMTVSVYRSSSKGLRRASLAMAASTVLTALMTLLFLLLNHGEPLSHLLLCGAYLLCAGMATAIFLMESNVPYATEQSTEYAPEYAEAIF